MRPGVRLKHIRRVRKPSGKVFVYFDAPGRKRVRLPDLPENEPAFLTAYAAAAADAPQMRTTRAEDGTLGALALSYLASPAFRGLAQSTRENRRRIIAKILARGNGAAAEARVAGLRARHLRADLADLAPHAAVNRRKVWGYLLAHALNLEWIEASPLAGAPRPKARTEGHLPWTREALEAWRARWPLGSTPRAAAELAAWTGARRSDLAGMGRQMVGRDGWLSFRQAKTGGEVAVPLFCELPDWMLEADDAGDLRADHAHVRAGLEALGGRLLFLERAPGGAYSVKGLSMRFATWAREVPGWRDGCTLHGARKFRLSALAGMGWSDARIMAWSGHASRSEVTLYTRAADRRRILGGTERDRNTGNRAAER